jgi:hypothetical protein
MRRFAWLAILVPLVLSSCGRRHHTNGVDCYLDSSTRLVTASMPAHASVTVANHSDQPVDLSVLCDFQLSKHPWTKRPAEPSLDEYSSELVDILSGNGMGLPEQPVKLRWHLAPDEEKHAKFDLAQLTWNHRISSDWRGAPKLFDVAPKGLYLLSFNIEIHRGDRVERLGERVDQIHSNEVRVFVNGHAEHR